MAFLDEELMEKRINPPKNGRTSLRVTKHASMRGTLGQEV